MNDGDRSECKYMFKFIRVVTNNHEDEDDHDGNARLILVKTLLLTPNAD